MANKTFSRGLSRLFSDYGMFVALLILCALISVLTWDEQHPAGPAGGTQVAAKLVEDHLQGTRVLIVTRENEEDKQFAEALQAGLAGKDMIVLDTIHGTPIDVRKAMNRIVEAGNSIDLIACTEATAAWPLFENLGDKIPALAETALVQSTSYYWPNFLKTNNLLNVANQIVVIAIIAIGMTMVIITGGIDLSVGSLIALSAVVSTLLIRDAAGAEQAGAAGMALCCFAGIAVCALVGLFSGTMVSLFDIPPFIVTLGMMMVASGAAYILAEGQSIYQIPETFIWLGRGTAFMKVPISVTLMLTLYVLAHIMMTRTRLGRHIYAVGGNREGARLSGVPIKFVVLAVYTFSATLAGVGGVIMASRLKSGSPTYGLMYELYVIAAAVVGGTSLTGGEGRILGTLIGAFIIAVIQNGMNLTGVESYTQKVVLGLVILGAVLFDMLKKRGWSGLFKISRS